MLFAVIVLAAHTCAQLRPFMAQLLLYLYSLVFQRFSVLLVHSLFFVAFNVRVLPLVTFTATKQL